HRISADGVLTKTDIDTNSVLKTPYPLDYLVQAYGDELHIRGAFLSPISSKATAFCVIDYPDRKISSRASQCPLGDVQRSH
ncbi:hypothetical protein KDH83_31200, partial [Achromobacter sp. Marseille-Q0513]|uniref:hypothetical protein n=1 Tax=Achromobacter sp. Marseille-Q0513 TaxID=2829161 RepID=UPI001BA0CEA5